MFFILTSREPLVNKRDLQALYLSGTYCHRIVLDPLAVLLLENRLYINFSMKKILTFENGRCPELNMRVWNFGCKLQSKHTNLIEKATRVYKIRTNKTGLQPVTMTCGTGLLLWRVGRGC